MSASWIAAFAALALVVTALAVVVLGLLRRIAPVLERVEAVHEGGTHVDRDDLIGGLHIGSRIPLVTALDEHGREQTLDSGDQPAVYLIVEPGCAFCETLVEDLRSSAEVLPVHIFLICDDDDEGRQFVAGIHAPNVGVFFQNGEVSTAFRTTATPYAFVVENRNVVSRGHPNRLRSLLDLIGQADRGDAPADLERTAKEEPK
jgi:hypothetical protein